MVSHGVSAAKLSPVDARGTFSVPGLDGYSWNNEIKCVVQTINVINVNRLIMGKSLYSTRNFNVDAIMQDSGDSTRSLP